MPEWKFYREHGNIKKEERVEPEKWQWVADYGKESLYQFDKDGVFHQFKEIDQSKLASFRMICEGQKDIIIKWNKDYKLIHFYRNMSLENGQINLRLYCFGFETEKTKVIFVIMPDNTVVVTDDIESVKVKA